MDLPGQACWTGKCPRSRCCREVGSSRTCMEDVALRFRGEPSSAKGKGFGHTEGKVVLPL